MAKANRKFELSAIIRMVDRITTPARRIYHAIQRNIIRPFGRAASAVSRFAASLAKFGAIAGATAIGAGIAFLTKSVTNFADAADKMAKSSRQVGLTVEQLSRLAYAADLSGVSLDELIAGLRPFAKNVELARLQQGELYSTLRKASPALLKQLAATKTVEEAFLLMAGAVHSAESETRKATLASLAFGRSGAKMATLFSNGADGVRKLTEEADRLGFTLSTESAEAAEQFNDDLNRLKRTLGLVSRLIGESLIPVLDPLIQKAIEWSQANRGLVAEKVAQWVQGVVDAIRRVNWTNAWESTKRFASALGRLADAFGGAEGAAKLFAVSVGVTLTSKALGLAAALWKVGAAAWGGVIAPLGKAAVAALAFGARLALVASAHVLMFAVAMSETLATAIALAYIGFQGLWALMLANPIVAIGAAFAALAALLIAKWEPIAGWFKDMWDGIYSYIEPIITAITDAIDATIDGLRAIGILDAPTPIEGPVVTSQAGAFRALGFDPARFGVVSAQKQESAIQLDVKFDNAPPGLRVNQRTEGAPVSGNVQVQTNNTGNRTLATGAPL